MEGLMLKVNLAHQRKLSAKIKNPFQNSPLHKYAKRKPWNLWRKNPHTTLQ